MGLNKASGNMYEGWITHTWNTIKGECPHNCIYCYMKRWSKLNPVRFDQKELKTDLGKGNTIFVGSSCDMFADDIEPGWVIDTLNYCKKYDENTYLFQTKNPKNFGSLGCHIADLSNFILCITLESNIWYPKIANCPSPASRAMYFKRIPNEVRKMITIEPIMDFDLMTFVAMIKKNNPESVNIGFNTSFKIELPEPTEAQTIELINELRKFTKVVLKSNAKRIIKDNLLYL